MLGAAGVILPDFAAKIGVSWPGANVNWVDAATFDYFAPAGSLFVAQLFLMAWVENKRGADIANPGSQAQDPIFTSNKLPAGEVGYPGGIFDPMACSPAALRSGLQHARLTHSRLVLASSTRRATARAASWLRCAPICACRQLVPRDCADAPAARRLPSILQMKLKEIKNGRLAMLACAGFAVQAATTGTSSPIENLFTHMAAPWSTTVLSNQPDLCAPTPLRPRDALRFVACQQLTACVPTAAQVRVALGRPDLPVQPGAHQGPAAGGLSARRVTTARARAS